MAVPIASVQLYSLNVQFAADMAGSLDKLAALGLRHVEAFDFVERAAELRAALDGSGLSAPTGHAPLLSDELWTPGGTVPAPPPEKVFEAAATVGVQTVIDPFVAPSRWYTADGVDDIAARLNEAAEAAASFGLSVGYHNHAQEFAVSFDGATAYERAVSRLDERVRLELDLYWAAAGGQDVPALARSLGSRLVAVHVKDGAVIENPWAPGAPDLDPGTLEQTHAGKGEIPLAAALRANDAVEYAVIEYDKAPGDVFDDVAASLSFLRAEGLAQ
ncbi:sugar phosphate isomerase/epimerase family protein [Nocardiopsis composta]|uniref:Sugar phosphate isomerase/epimerase n=1 Tax=Nocardiopsis composta TaxID=157465 RepID=A0A7W8QQG0_9ACTN|nr:sugar phosphate isomerase/epimerase [Nocardiopsis composta]MBB5434599.1 sugar phosphate isomerase/epimerase [Nocardiopsis composta]